MSEYLKEAKRLAQAYADAVLLGEGNDEALAALLAHIQRGAVPVYCTPTEHEGRIVYEHTSEPIPNADGFVLYTSAPDQFRDAAKMMAEPAADHEFEDISRAALLWVLWHHKGGSSPVGQPIRFALGMGQHEHLNDWQVAEAKRWGALCGLGPVDCSEPAPAPAEVPMPEPVAYGIGDTAITGHTNRLMMVRIVVPLDDQYAGAHWLPLVLADEARTYGERCRAAGEAAGYARGLKEAGRDGERLNFLENECNDLRAVSTGEDDYEWAVISHHMAPPKEREVGSGRNVRDAIDAALRGEVKP